MENTDGIRLNKYLSEHGVCSRREADREIEKGNVLIDGKLPELGQKVLFGQEVTFCGKVIEDRQEEDILLLVNKPKGIICTSAENEQPNIVSFLNYPTRIYPIGRLDKESSGLILMTNQGDLVNKIMRAGNYHEKEYVVSVTKPITSEFLKQMSQGVYLDDLDEKTRPCKVYKQSKYTFRIVLTQGLNRQIRRMCNACGYKVKFLKRIRIMNLKLEGIEEGKYREISSEEKETLMMLLKDSTSQSKYAK